MTLLHWLVATTAIVGTELVWLGAFLGIGALLMRGLGHDAESIEDLAFYAWVGFAVVLLCLLVWHQALPIDRRAAVVVLGLGAVGLVGERARLRKAFAERPHPFPPLAVWLGVGLAFWLANLAQHDLQSWDSSLYHLQGVLWSKAYPVVPGLVNLYGPLGFNNSGFLYSALLDVGPWSGGAEHVANGALMLLVCLQAALGSARLLAGRPGPTSAFDLTVLTPVLALALQQGGIASFETHLGATLCLFAAASRSLYAVTATSSSRSARANATIVFLLLAAAVTLKSSTAVFVAGFAVAYVLLTGPRWRSARDGLRIVGVGAVAAGLFAVVWAWHGVVLSGYPAFPSTLLGADVDWAAPVRHAQAEWAYASFSEREFAWAIGPRWLHEFASLPYLSWLAVVVAAVGAWSAARGGRELLGDRFALRFEVLSVPSGIALVVWLLTVPALRYAVAFFWIPAAYAVTLASRSSTARAPRWSHVLTALAISGPLVIPMIGASGNPFVEILRDNITTPGNDVFFVHARPEPPPFRTYVTRSGLRLHVPEGDERCWDVPIPCTPNPSPTLELRGEGRLAAGFRVAGEWRMQNFPYRWQAQFRDEWPSRPDGAPLPGVE